MATQRFHITLSDARAAALRFQARRLNVSPTRLAADYATAALDRLMADGRWLEQWELDAKQRAQQQAYERMRSAAQ